MQLRVMVVDSDANRAAELEHDLTAIGYQIVCRVEIMSELCALAQKTHPDVIVIARDKPDKDCLACIQMVSNKQPCPIVMFTDDSDSRIIEAAVKAGVSAYVVDGRQQHRIKPIIEAAVARFRQYQALRDEVEHAKSSLAERKVIDRAKGILMSNRGITEDEAYHSLRKLAMKNNKRLAEVAEGLVSAAELLT